MSFRKIEQSIIFLLALTFYGYFIRPGDWNINSRLGLVKAIVEEKRLVIDSYHEDELITGDKAYFNGHYYSDKAIGTSLLGAIVYLPIYIVTGQSLSTELFIMLMTVLAISIPCALLAPLLYGIALQIVKEKWMALVIALCISLGTPIFPYASAFYGHSLAAVQAFTVFLLWMEVNQFNAKITPGRLFASGFLIGFMVLTEYTTLIIAVILIGYMTYVVRSKQGFPDWKTVGMFFLGGTIPLIIFISYNWICFGSPLTIGYANENNLEFKEVHSQGLMGIELPNIETLFYMTIHPMQGIFIQSPVLLMAFSGFMVMKREKKMLAELIAITSMILVYFLVISGFQIWWGGAAFTVRHLIPILPFFGIFFIFVPRKYYKLFIGLGILSFSQMLVASAVIYDFVDKYIRQTLGQGFALSLSWKNSLFYRELFPRLLHHQLTFTWGKYLFGLESWYFNFAVPLTIAFVLLTIFYFVSKKEDKTY
ncbi:MAG: hypothetical protein NTW69_17505 [Chloroflexi bacterium]|nr:hypothetical protein [Chloroflexota bacterium]